MSDPPPIRRHPNAQFLPPEIRLKQAMKGGFGLSIEDIQTRARAVAERQEETADDRFGAAIAALEALAAEIGTDAAAGPPTQEQHRGALQLALDLRGTGASVGRQALSMMAWPLCVVLSEFPEAVGRRVMLNALIRAHVPALKASLGPYGNRDIDLVRRELMSTLEKLLGAELSGKLTERLGEMEIRGGQ